MQVLRRPPPVEAELVSGDFGGVDRLALLGLWYTESLIQDIHEHWSRDFHQFGPQRLGRDVGPNGDLDSTVDPAGIQTLSHLHQAHPGGLVSGQDGPFHGGCPPPSGQQREMNVDHGQPIQNMGLDDLPEGHHDTKIGIGVQHIVHIGGNWDVQHLGGGLHRAGRGVGPSPPALVGPGHRQGHIESGLIQCLQERHRLLRSAEVNEPANVRRRVDHGSDSPSPLAGGLLAPPIARWRRMRLASRR